MEFNKADYPKEIKSGRIELSIKWLSKNIDTLLDGGCCYGYSTVCYKRVAKNVYGIEISEDMLHIAKEYYPEINFINANLENTGLKSNFADAIVLNDSLEHTDNDLVTINEMYRLLKNNGELIITVPSKGLFGFLDPYNYGYYLNQLFPFLYSFIKGIKYKIKGEKLEKKKFVLSKHRHYSLKNIINLLEKSDFKDKYKIEKVKHCGLFLEPLILNLEMFLVYFIKQRIVNKIVAPLKKLSDFDYNINYSVLGYCLAVKILKTN